MSPAFCFRERVIGNSQCSRAMKIPWETVLTHFPPPHLSLLSCLSEQTQHIPYCSFKASSVSDFASLKPSSGLFWTAVADQQDSEELFVHLWRDIFSFTGMFEFLKCQRVSVGGGAFAWFLF